MYASIQAIGHVEDDAGAERHEQDAWCYLGVEHQSEILFVEMKNGTDARQPRINGLLEGCAKSLFMHYSLCFMDLKD